MLIPVREIRLRAEWQGRRLALAAVAALLVTAGLAFLCAALWTALRDGFGPITASLSLGALLLVAALIVVVLRQMRPAPYMPSLEEQVRIERAAGKPYPQPNQVAALVDAMILGMNVYLRLRDRRR